MFFLVPGLSVAAKCTVIGAACVTVAAVEVLQARSRLESFKTKAGSAFASFKWRTAAKPSEHFSKAHNENNEIIKASVATDDTVKFDYDHCACALQPSAIDITMQDLDKLSVEAAVDGGPAAACDDSVRKQVDIVDGRSLDACQHLDSTFDVVAGVQTARGNLSLMPDLEGEAADVKIKAVRMAAIGEPHLDPIVEKNAEVIKVQLVSSIGNSCRANNLNGRSWASRVFKGTRDFVMGPINNVRSWLSRVFGNTGDFLRGFIDRIISWLGKMYEGIYGCAETVDLKNWILDHEVILKKILLVLVDFFMETPSFWTHHKSDIRLLCMRLYRLLRSELRW